MSALWILLGLIGLALCLWLVSRFLRPFDLGAWREAAVALKLEFASTRFQRRPKLKGLIDRQTLEIEGSAEGEAALTRFRLRSHGQVSDRLALRPASSSALAPAAEAVLTGDEVFDRNVRAMGPEDVVLGALDAEARKKVLDFVVCLKGEVVGGELRVDLPQLAGAEELVGVVRTMREVAEELQSTAVPDALCHNAEHDPVAKVRQNNLLALAKFHQGQAGHIERLAQRATADADPNVMLSAVAHLLDPQKGREALEKVIGDDGGPEDTRKKALEFVLAKFPHENAWGALDGALDRKAPGLALLAVQAIGARRDLRFVDGLSKLAGTKDLTLAKAVAEALGKLRDPRGETALLRLLEREELPVRRAAVAALARAGTARAVEPLLPLTKGFLGDPVLKDEAQEAVRWIQGRIGVGGDAGGLSVIREDGREGSLSIAEERGGELSLPKKAKDG